MTGKAGKSLDAVDRSTGRPPIVKALTIIPFRPSKFFTAVNA
jgi:hypothetical protein